MLTSLFDCEIHLVIGDLLVESTTSIKNSIESSHLHIKVCEKSIRFLVDLVDA